MNSLAVFEFENQELRFVNGKPVANDVARILGYARPADAIYKRVKQKNKERVKIPTAGGYQSGIVLKEQGILELVASSRLPGAIDIANGLNICILKCAPEQESIRILQAAFSDLEPIYQFPIQGYRIDLYLSKVNIAIECDEHNHKGYSSDREREDNIKLLLGCTFVRFNPDEDNFNIGSVIRTIRYHINQ